MAANTYSMEVNAPLRAVYNQWTQFEEFPRFMKGIEEVRQEGDKRLFWRARIGGKVKEWEAQITNQLPDVGIAWESLGGTIHSGIVTFESLDANRTKVVLTLEYQPEDLLEKAGDAIGIPSLQIEEDLKRFRDFIEERGRETGGWRGEIILGKTSHPQPATETATSESVRSMNKSGTREQKP
jgi:uncharacterized membrane protein